MKRSVAEIHPINSDQTSVSRTIAESAYRRIRQDILWGRFAPGSPLRSDELRARYGIGVSPLREALTRLVSERLVTSVGQRGFRVAPLTAYDVEDTMQTRIIIEQEALITLHPPWRHGLGNGAGGGVPCAFAPSRSEGAGAGHRKLGVFHRQFHMALLSACGSQWLMELAGLLFDQAERQRILRTKFGPQKILKRDTAREHKQIFEAAISRDAKAAVRALDSHYQATAEQVVSVLSRIPRVVAKRA